MFSKDLGLLFSFLLDVGSNLFLFLLLFEFSLLAHQHGVAVSLEDLLVNLILPFSLELNDKRVT